ncbi:MAG: Flp family type IVb pilin [Myxococcota bacterium]
MIPSLKQKLATGLVSFHEDESAATATEYIILLILIACFVIAIVKVFGENVSSKYDDAGDGVRKEVTF